MNILVVDDDAAIREVLRLTLQAEGLHTFEAADGLEALAVLEREPIEAIISDILMPNMDGYQLCHQVRCNPKSQQVPVLFYTGIFTSPNDEQLAQKVGVDRFFHKPTPTHILLQAVREVQSRRTGQSARVPLAKDFHVNREYNELLVKKLEEKNLELELQTSELRGAQQQIQHLLAHSPAVLYSLAIDGPRLVPVWVSENITRLLGFEAREVLRAEWWPEHLHPEDRARIVSSVAQLHARGQLTEEYRFCQKNGTYRWVRDELQLVRDSAGQPAQVAGCWTDITERKRSEQRLSELSLRLQRAQDEERRRIARELHDSTAQKLAALTMNLGTLDDELGARKGKAKRILCDSISLLQDCAQEIRTISFLLHPPLLDDLGLLAALRHYIEEFSKRSGIQTTVDVPARLPELTDAAALALFRVTQESLGNIHRHSGSKTALVRLTCDARGLMLEVRDHGRGLPAEMAAGIIQMQGASGVGIVGMRERLRPLGGQLEIENSNPGVTVRATLPHLPAEPKTERA